MLQASHPNWPDLCLSAKDLGLCEQCPLCRRDFGISPLGGWGCHGFGGQELYIFGLTACVILSLIESRLTL